MKSSPPGQDNESASDSLDLLYELKGAGLIFVTKSAGYIKMRAETLCETLIEERES